MRRDRSMPPTFRYQPTAVHSVADTHDTPSRSLLLVPTFGLARRVQVEPFQNTMSVRSTLAAVLNEPTAVHRVADTHETSRRPLSVVPTFGLATRVHVVPFQISTSVRPTFAGVS